MTTLTPTQRLALGRLESLHRPEVLTRLGRITQQDVRTSEELAREVLRATWRRAEEV